MKDFGPFLLCVLSIGLLQAAAPSPRPAADRSLEVSAAHEPQTRASEPTKNAEDRNLEGGQVGGLSGFASPFSGPGMNSMMAGNMMVGNALTHPLVNPFSMANPFSPMNPGNPFSPLNPLNQRNPAAPYVTIEDDDVVSDGSLAFPADLASEVFDDEKGLRVINRCASVKEQALEIANRLMKKQNNKIFKELVSYLVKAKFLIGMTEIKLTRSLRKRVFGLMTAFSSLDHGHFNFVDPETVEPDRPSYPTEEFASVYPSIDDPNTDNSHTVFGHETKI